MWLDHWRQKGVVFVDELDGIPDGSVVIFSAHGVSKAVRQEAQSRGLEIYDATCPLVMLRSATLNVGKSSLGIRRDPELLHMALC